MYDETNAMLGVENRGGLPAAPPLQTTTYRSSLHGPDTNYFGAADIGEDGGERDVEVYRNPGRVAPYARANYSGESIDLDMFEGPGEDTGPGGGAMACSWNIFHIAC